MLPLRLTLLIICISEFMDNSLSKWSVFIWCMIGGACHLIIHTFEYFRVYRLHRLIYTHTNTHTRMAWAREMCVRRGHPNITTFLCVHKTHQKSQMLNVNQLFYRIEEKKNNSFVFFLRCCRRHHVFVSFCCARNRNFFCLSIFFLLSWLLRFSARTNE